MLPIHFNTNFDKFFDEFFTQLPVAAGKQTPPVNIHETDAAYHLEVVAPGMKKEDFKINLENGLLTVSFEKQENTEEKNYKTHRREYRYESFTRSFTVDEKIKADGIAAKYDNGVLHVYLPKKEEIKITPKQITIE